MTSRLHWGCGADVAPGWINVDRQPHPGVDLSGDILDGLAMPDDSVDYATSQHALPELGIYDQVPALRELHRVLRPGGVLRLCLPDLDLAIAAYQEGRAEQFLVYEWDTLAGNFITHVLWYGISRTPFTFEFAAELLAKAGFQTVWRAGFGWTGGPWPAIVELDTRPDESFYIEGLK